MAFNYMNTSCPGRYAYRMPMHLIQQMDHLSAMHLPSSSDLCNFVNNSSFPHCNPGNQQVRPPLAEVCSGANADNDSMKNVISDLSSIHRPVSEYCMSSASTDPHSLSMHGTVGQYRPTQSPAQPKYIDQPQALSENCRLDLAISKTPDISSVLCGSGNEFNNLESTSQISVNLGESQNCKDTKKDKKYKRIRYVKPGCDVDCQRRCKQKISQNTREDLFNEFWNLENDAKGKDFISRHANKMPMMTCKEGSRRSFSVDWAFCVGGESFSVCKLFFLDTLDVSEEMAYSAMKETEYFNPGSCVTMKKKAKKRKSVWLETDIDAYSELKATHHAQPRPRCGSKREKITELRPGCTDACRRNCQSKFTHNERLALFTGYRSFNNLRRQKEFIMEHVKKLERKYVRSDKTTRRGCSIAWMLPLKGKKIPVCKTFFLHTVGISEHIAYSVGMQNEMQSVPKTKTPKREQHPSWVSMKHKYLKSLIAKGKLKSNLKLILRNGKGIVSAIKDGDIHEDIIVESFAEKTCLPEGSQKLDSEHNHRPSASVPDNDASVSYAGFPFHQAHGSKQSKQAFGKDKISVSSESLHVNFPVPTLSQEYQLECSLGGSCSYSQQQQGCLNCDHNSCHNAQLITNSTSTISCQQQNSHDALLLQTLKTTTGDLFPVSNGPEVQGDKRSIPPGQDVRKKLSGRVRENIPFSKQMKEGCTETCRRKCNQKIPHSVREELFNEFWMLESDVCRREYILPIVNKIPKKRNKNSDSRRGCTIEWSVPYNGELHVVCKKFFLDTYDISENFVKTVHDKMERNDGSMEDMRGKHGKRSTVFIKEESEIENYVQSVATYKAVRCMRCNSDFPRWCFDQKITSSQFYKDYAENRKVNGAKPACRTSFTNFCAKKFNIKPSNPHEYVCGHCVS